MTRLIAITLLFAGLADTAFAAPDFGMPVEDIFMSSKWDVLPPWLKNDDGLSMYGGYSAGGGFGRNPYANLGATQHIFFGDGVVLFSGEGFVTQDAAGGASALLHGRHLIGDGLIGAGFSYTVHESELDRNFEQFGVHLEWFPTINWSIRANGYIPNGAVERQSFNSGPVPGTAVFQNNNIVIPTLTTTIDESTMQGFDIELARKLGDFAAEAFAAYYKFDGRRTAPDAEGGRLGVRGYITDRLSADVNVTYDDVFDSTVYGGVTYRFGGGATLAPENICDKLTAPVERNRQIVIRQVTSVTPGSVIVTDGGAPITVTHVQDGAPGGNVGTFEDPFNTNMLPGTQATDLIYVHSGGTYTNGYTLAADQRLLGEGGGNVHMINTDQFGIVPLGAGNGGFAQPIIQGPIVAADGSEISNFDLQPAGLGISLPGLAGDVNVNRTSITGGGTAIDIAGGSGNFHFTDVDISDPTMNGFNITGGTSSVTFGSLLVDPAAGQYGPSSMTQTAGGNLFNVTGGHTGTLLVNAGSTLGATSGTGLQFDNADGTYMFDGTVTLNGGDAGIDILNASDGTFTFADTDITSPTGSGLRIGQSGVAGSGGTANVTFASLSSLTQANAAAASGIFGDHTGTFTFDGPINATNGTGLQFGDAATSADGTYNFNGATVLNGGDAGIDILGTSTGTFTFADTTITDPTGVAFNIDGLGGTSEANVNYNDGTITQTNNAATFRVVDHDNGTVVVEPNILATNGTGFQFSNADGTYDFNGTLTFNGGDAGIDILGGSDGTFTFNRPTITNPTGVGVNVVGGTAEATFEGLNVTTTGTTGINIDSTGLTTILANADVTTDGAVAVDINNTQVNMRLRNIISTNSTAEAIDIDSALAGSVFNVTGLTRVINAAGNGIDIATSEGTFTFTNTDIDGTVGHGINLTGNPDITSVTIDGGEIDGTTLDGIHVENTNGLTVDGILFGRVTPVAGDAIDYLSNDGTARNVTLTNNSTLTNGNVVGRGITIAHGGVGTVNAVVTDNDLLTTGQTFVTSDSGNAGSLILQLDNNAFDTLAADFASDVVGSGANSTIVTSLDSNTLSGRGMLFDRVTFDDSGALLGGVQVQAAGITNVNFVSGDGLSFIDPTGDLRYEQLNINNFGGTGLEVFTKGLGTTFNLEVQTGSIDTFGGPAMFLDPLTANIELLSVSSSSSLVLGAPGAIASGNGTGIFIDELTASGGLGTQALSIASLTIENSASHGVRIEDSQGLFDFETVDVDGTGGDAFSLVDNNDVDTHVTVNGGTIIDTAGNGVSANDTNLTVRGVEFGQAPDPDADPFPIPYAPIGGDAISIVQEDGMAHSHSIQNVTSGPPVDDMSPPSIIGRGIVIETSNAATGTVSASVFGSNLITGGTTLRANTNANPNQDILQLAVNNNTFEANAAAPTIDIDGNNIDPLTNTLLVMSFGNNTVTGNGVGGGVVFRNVTFDNGAGGQVFGGTTTIGTNAGGPAGDAERVQGNGLALFDTSGDLGFTQLDIANDGGVGLLVDTKTDLTVFNLTTAAGTVDTTAGPAMFLDPLTANLVFDTVISSGSVGGPGISTGDGLTIDGLVGNLTIADLQISDAAAQGIQIEDSTGNFIFTTVAIATTGADGVLVGSLGANPATVRILGGTIDGTGDDGVDIRNTSLFQLSNVTFTNHTGFTGNFLNNAQLTGVGNIDETTFSSNDAGGNNGTILFNNGVDQAP